MGETRKQYREDQAKQRRQDQMRSLNDLRKRFVHRDKDSSTNDQGEDHLNLDNDEFLSRQENIQNQKLLITKEKTDRLGHRLNRVILVLVILIILVYLVLFFVG